jgi:hypothetical protein
LFLAFTASPDKYFRTIELIPNYLQIVVAASRVVPTFHPRAAKRPARGVRVGGPLESCYAFRYFVASQTAANTLAA